MTKIQRVIKEYYSILCKELNIEKGDVNYVDYTTGFYDGVLWKSKQIIRELEKEQDKRQGKK